MIHIAVLLRPYLDAVLSGAKTVECRLTRQARDPYQNIEPGERIYFKQSAGPYGATAIADHVLFEDSLTPSRVKRLQRDYNHLIKGEDSFWDRKRDSRFATLIWLREVVPTSTGPEIRPLQGVAWLTLENESPWRRIDGGAEDTRIDAIVTDSFLPELENQSCVVKITPGNLRNGTLYATSVAKWFPAWTRGGPTRREAARPITLMLLDGPTVQTDIVAARQLFRTRVWRSWFKQHKALAGDGVIFTVLDESTYSVGLIRAANLARISARRHSIAAIDLRSS